MTSEDYSGITGLRNLFQGCADDIGGTLDQLKFLKATYDPMIMIQHSAGLTLNAAKYVIVPLCTFSPHVVFRIKRWLNENTPRWNTSIADQVKYIGLLMGPAVTAGDNFAKPFIKITKRVSSICEAPLLAAPAIFACNLESVNVLSFIIQLGDLPPDIADGQFELLAKVLKIPFGAF